MCSETSPPRISFSNDLAHVVDDSQIEIPRRDAHLLDSDWNSDFEFSFTSFEQESRSADELFANGMILPVQGKNAIAQRQRQRQRQQQIIRTKNPPPKIQNPVTKTEDNNGESSKSFWKFKKSNSLKCDVNTKSIMLPFPILSRSNSTGSLQNSKKLKSIGRSSLSSSSNSATQKPPSMKKNNYGMKISPVLNVPLPPYISRSSTANLLGFGFLLRNGKDTKNKK